MIFIINVKISKHINIKIIFLVKYEQLLFENYLVFKRILFFFSSKIDFFLIFIFY